MTLKWLKWSIPIGVILAAALTIFAFRLPAEYNYTKQIDIVAQQRMVFVFIGELKRWKEWTKWAARDPNMQNEYSEPSWGEGATYEWRSFWVSDGSVRVTKFQKEKLMAYELMGAGELSQWTFALKPALRQGTTVTWTVQGLYPENRFLRLLAYARLWRLPSDMEKGLERLRKHAELHEAYDVVGDWEPKRTKP